MCESRRVQYGWCAREYMCVPCLRHDTQIAVCVNEHKLGCILKVEGSIQQDGNVTLTSARYGELGEKVAHVWNQAFLRSTRNIVAYLFVL